MQSALTTCKTNAWVQDPAQASQMTARRHPRLIVPPPSALCPACARAPDRQRQGETWGAYRSPPSARQAVNDDACRLGSSPGRRHLAFRQVELRQAKFESRSTAPLSTAATPIPAPSDPTRPALPVATGPTLATRQIRTLAGQAAAYIYASFRVARRRWVSWQMMSSGPCSPSRRGVRALQSVGWLSRRRLNCR